MTRAVKNVSFSQPHYELITKISRERRMKFSEILRMVIDFAIDHDSSLGLPFHADREKALQAELSTVQGIIQKLEEQAKNSDASEERVFSKVPQTSGVRSVPNAPFVDRRPGVSAEEQWRTKLRHFLNPPAFLLREQTETIATSVIELAKDHPAWIDGLEVGERDALKAKMGQAANV